jgi:hypothetical protein
MDTKVTISRPDWADDVDMIHEALNKILYDGVDVGRVNLRGRTVALTLHTDGQHVTAELLERESEQQFKWVPHINQIGKRFRPVDVVNLPGENQD